MATTRLRLECPSHHELYFNPTSENYSRPIHAAVVLTNHSGIGSISDLSQLQICLVRMLSITGNGCLADDGNLLNRLNRWMSASSQSSVPETSQICSILEELTIQVPTLGPDNQVGSSLEGGKIHKIPFVLPFSVNTPGSSATPLGSISYFLVACMTTADGISLSECQEIALTHRLIPEHDSIQHTCIYPNSSLVTKISLTQYLASTTRSKISFGAEISVQPATPAGRSTEYKRIAVRGIRWRVEEISKLFIQAECQDIIETRSSIREISNGFNKGYWTAEPSISAEDNLPQNTDSSVTVPLEIIFPKDSIPTPEVSLSCYDSLFKPADSLPLSLKGCFFSTTQQMMMLTIEYRLKLDILTTEDTFSVYGHDLVDRRPPRIAMNASFPLQVIDRAEGNIEEILGPKNPPRYEEVPISAPTYEE